MRAARDFGWPPLVYWGKRKIGWKNLLAAEALRMYEDSLCGKCGQSGFHALNSDPANPDVYEVDADAQCLGCEQLEQYSDADAFPGTKLRIVWTPKTKAVTRG
jgi:hypothetical protein